MKKVKKILATVLALNIAFTNLVGCSNKKSENTEDNGKNNTTIIKDDNVPILSGTLLENTVVAIVDYSIPEYPLLSLQILKPIFCNETPNPHFHYQDIVTGQIIKDYIGCYCDEIYECRQILVLNQVYYYLTEDELNKALNNELTKEDIIHIIYRIEHQFSEITDNTLTKIK